MQKLNVGDKVYDLSLNEYIITAVGRKYYTISKEDRGYFTRKILIEDLTYKDKWGTKRYSTDLEGLKMRKHKEALVRDIASEIRKSYNYFNLLTVEELETLKSITLKVSERNPTL